MNIKKILLNDIAYALEKCGLDKSAAQVSFSGKPELADFQSNIAFSLAKSAKRAPIQIAEVIAQNLPESDLYEVSVVPPAFINFKLTDKAINEFANFCLKDEMVGLEKLEKPRKIFMDFGGANVAKELHIGHLRSPIIGEALSRLHKELGDTVISDVYLGDWGTQMGLTIAELEDEGHLEFYFGRSSEKEQITLDMLNIAYPKASSRKKVDPAFKEKAAEYTLYVQGKKQPYYGIYEEIRKVSVERIKQNYDVLGCHFDLWNGESTAQPYVAPTIQIFKDKNLAKISDGALIVDVSEPGENVPSGKFDENGKELLINPMPPVMLQKANGADIYDTTEIATINMRYQKYHPDEFIYVVDNRQSGHFVITFRAAKKAEIVAKNTKLTHVSYGTMNGTDGKPFKTRSGDTIKLEDIINLIKDSAKRKLEENGIVGDDELALKIGLAAMKFGDLSSITSRDYVFDIDKFASFEGKTGPYIQYTGTRIKSLISKAGKYTSGVCVYGADERELVINLIKLNESYYSSYNEYSLNSLCLALYNFCATFSRFYNNTKILTEKDNSKRNAYISICQLALKAIVKASNVLGFEIPEKM
ncbi:MAG: arginine--tRNA ligase [Clostridia bacterium]|nr:arginine--tRNA ligase [Clostridia bacterium]